MTLQGPVDADHTGVLADPCAPEILRKLVVGGHLPPGIPRAAQAIAAREGLAVLDVLQTRFSLSQRSMLLAEHGDLAAQIVDPVLHPPDRELVLRLGAARSLTFGVLPWQRIGDTTLVLCPHFSQFNQHRARLEQVLGPVRMALCTADQITATVCEIFGPELAHEAENRLSPDKSCRNWQTGRILRLTIAAMAVIGAATAHAPLTAFTLLTSLAVGMLLLSTLIKTAAAVAGLRAGPNTAPPLPASPLPVITLLVPLYREKAIAEHLLKRLAALDYPREKLDVCLVLEDNDKTTKEALAGIHLLTWMRAIVVPKGTLRTKPRAMNYALDFARGSIIGVYDAEDAPAPDQLRIVAACFAQAGPRVACLQGVLDYYNSTANWLTRCFTIEYASWFRVILPGYARMGFVVPLGGTSLFFRRDILDQLGGWDAHNVTEDADLGIRLARAGFETVFIPTVTEEEANGRFWPWVKQRSRWLKGYAMTYCVHMRTPRQLWRQLGAWRFFGLQVLFAGTLSQFLLAPLIWSFWLIPLGFYHPAAAFLPVPAFWTMVGFFVASECANFAIAALALHRAGKLSLLPWALSLQFYFPLGSAAVYKGMLELLWKPFYWDKTMHGVLLPPPNQPSPPLAPSRRPALAASQTPAKYGPAGPHPPRPPPL